MLYSRSILVMCVFEGQKSRSSDLGSSGPRSQSRDGQFSHPKTGGYAYQVLPLVVDRRIQCLVCFFLKALVYHNMYFTIWQLHVLATWQSASARASDPGEQLTQCQVSGKRPITSSAI